MLQPSTPVEQLGEDIAALTMRIHAATCGTPFDLGNVIDAVRVPVHAS